MTASQPDYLPAVLEQIRDADDATARALLERAARDHPHDPRPLLLIAGGLANSGAVDAAEAAYILALQRAPDFAIARFQLGLLQLTGGRPGAAFATWGPLDALEHTDPFRLFKRAFEALVADRLDEARRLFAEGIARNTANDPLNRDMHIVLDRITKLGASPSGATSEPPATAGQGGAKHFLISAYSEKS